MSDVAAGSARRVLAGRGVAAVGRLLFAVLAGISVVCAGFLLPYGNSASAQPSGPPSLRPLTIGFVRHVFGPWTARIADGGFEKATGRTIRWQHFSTDSEVVAAMAGGQVDVGLIGAGVGAAAFAHGFDLRVFYVLGRAPENDAIVRAGSEQGNPDPRSLAKKVVAVPFGSTPHFMLLSSLRSWGLNLQDVRIVNLQVPQILKAWSRKEIDAAAVSEPALSRLKRNGSVLAFAPAVSSGDFIVMAAAADFVSKHEVFLARMIDVMSRSQDDFEVNATGFTESAADVRSIAFVLDVEPASVVSRMGRYRAPALIRQYSAAFLGGGPESEFAAGLKETAEIWHWGARLNSIEIDFARMLTPLPVGRALTYKR
ncbi:MAG: ABC transporter substrate-binding protein [Hyphomicrobiaceae bacterium]